MESVNDDVLNCVTGGVNQDKFEELNGVITEILPNCGVNVQLDNGEIVKAFLSGQIRMNFIRIMVGDRVTVRRLAADGSNPRVVNRIKF